MSCIVVRCIGSPCNWTGVSGTVSSATANVKDALGPPLPAMFARYKDGLEEELRSALASLEGGNDTGDEIVALCRMLQYHMGWVDEKGDPMSLTATQGKALRPTLCLFTCSALGDDWGKALPAAAALEYVHNFSLIHDDIQDGDRERRHRPTVWSLWGQPKGIVAGNALRSIADITALRLAQLQVPQDKVFRASCLLTKGYLDMTWGQCLDLAFERDLDITLEDYLTMISCKTAALIRCGMEIGALIATDNESSIRSFERCGEFLGLAFQIRDDFLGTWGDEAATGKAVGADIRRKKKSFPMVYALEISRGLARKKLVDVYSKEDPDDRDVDSVLAVLDELNAAGYLQEVTRHKAQCALKEVEQVSMPSWARLELEELVEFITERQH